MLEHLGFASSFVWVWSLLNRENDVTQTKHILHDTISRRARRLTPRLEVILANILKSQTMRLHREEE